MARKAKSLIRPQQARSQATLDRLLSATERLLRQNLRWADIGCSAPDSSALTLAGWYAYRDRSRRS